MRYQELCEKYWKRERSKQYARIVWAVLGIVSSVVALRSLKDDIDYVLQDDIDIVDE